MTVTRTFIYTDGACSGNGKATAIGGWAFVVDRYSEEHHKRIIYHTSNGGEKEATNNKMELKAVLEALKNFQTYMEFDEDLTIVSDSKYFINCMDKKWYSRWRKNGWKNSNGEDVANRELWEEILANIEQIGVETVHFQWIKGHNGNKFNEMADELAVKGLENIRKKEKENRNE